MYENITYAELKKLPAVEKPEAWKELKTLCKTQKELAGKLGVSPTIVYSMISRYAGSEKKAVKLEDVKEPKKVRVKKQEQEVVVIEEKPAVIETNIEDVPQSEFSIAIKKVVSGEDAQFFLNGIGSTLLKSQKYLIELKITEK